MAPKVTKRRWYTRPVLLSALVGSLAFVAWFVFGPDGLYDSFRLQKLKRSQADQIRKYETEKQQLVAYLNALKANEDVAMERAARERRFVAPNEVIYDIKVDLDRP
jgi:cell division protein FtsB